MRSDRPEAPEPSSLEPDMPREAGTFDVVVVGAGGSGLACAASAAEAGARVVVLEKRPRPGGTTGLAVGSFTASGTSLQRRAGIDDRPAEHAEDAARFAPPGIEARGNTELRRWFLERAAETFEWLRGLGLSFHGPSEEPPNRRPRMHNAVPGARAYIATLVRHLERHGGTVLAPCAVRELLWEGGRVAGAIAEHQGRRVALRARAGVVLAAGDYAASSELIARFKGERFATVEAIDGEATGDGHRLAEAAGARLLNMDVTYGPELRFAAPRRTLLGRLPVTGPMARLLGALGRRAPRWLADRVARRLVVTWQHPEDALFDDGAILVDASGERVCDETRSPEREIAIASRPGKAAWILLDEPLADRYTRWPHFISTAPRIAYAYVDDYLRLRPDIAARAPLDALARRRGLPPGTLEATVEAYSAAAREGRPDPFGREAGRRPLEGERWVLLGPASARFTTTEGGAAVDRAMRVLDAEGRPIPGLRAVGQNGLGGLVLWGHGLHIAWALTSGRLAGRLLAEEADRSPAAGAG